MGRTYMCKECGEAYHRSEHDVCPNCGTAPEVTWRKRKEAVEPVPEEVVIEEPEPTEAIQAIEEQEKREFVVNSVEYYADVIIVGDNATMTFQNQHVAGKSVFCPRCNKRQFDVRLLYGAMNRKCDRCGLLITMIFS